MNSIQQMFTLQQQLNIQTNGNQWQNGTTQENRQISWHRCIYMEACEAIDSLNWKHWKNINSEPDWDNLRVELVDIWHFIMSEALRLNDSQYAEKYQHIRPHQQTDEAALLLILEQILSLSTRASIDKTQNPIRPIIDLFFQALPHIKMDIAELYQRYVVKNQLNIFRQQHGYKNGTYIKIWDGVEDNVAAFAMMDCSPNLTPEQLYQQLEISYAKINDNDAAKPDLD